MSVDDKLKQHDPAEELRVAIEELLTWHASVDPATFGDKSGVLNKIIQEFILEAKSIVDSTHRLDPISLIHRSNRDIDVVLDGPFLDDISEMSSQKGMLLYVKKRDILSRYGYFVRLIDKLCSELSTMKHENFKRLRRERSERIRFIERSVRSLRRGLTEHGSDELDRIKLWNEICSKVWPARPTAGSVRNLPEAPVPKPFETTAAPNRPINEKAGPASDARRSDGGVDRDCTAAPSLPSPLTAPPNGQRFKTHARDGEDILRFLDRVYGEPGYLTGAFTRADLRKIDPDAVVALEVWEQGTRTRPKGRAPLNLPTRTERNNQLRNADPATLTEAEKIARSRLLAIQRYEAKKAFNKN